MTDAEDRKAGDTATETHHEPHGAASPHGAADDVDAHEMDDDAGHAEHGGEELGPIDIPAWAAGVAGVALGLVVVACLVIATGP
jgi:hypothetical protein